MVRTKKTCTNCGSTLTLPSDARAEEREAYAANMCTVLYLSVMLVEGPKPCQGR
ncbi:hypothetical protein LCGC14_0410140 [marine sediment metagenome]|uniref:Uncharacterized protein n=1 Tax=marine sediment metagenome TaxID=412755 RepID=A0A0F9SU66_9ZZZZ